MSDDDRSVGCAEAAPGTSLGAVRALHDEIDAKAGIVAGLHSDRLQCRLGCSACCIDDLTVFEVEAERIEAEYPDLLRTGTPHAPGACAFLGDAGECRVYEARPQVCRTQGLPLRWLAEDAAGEIVERRSICELNAPGPPIDGLAEDDCWQLGPFEERLIRIQAERDGEGRRRVGLRDLFRHGV